MHKDISVNGKQYELQITLRELINDGRTSVSMSDKEVEALFADNLLVVLCRKEKEIIMDALDCLTECIDRDRDIVEPDQDYVDRIEALQEKWREAF